MKEKRKQKKRNIPKRRRRSFEKLTFSSRNTTSTISTFSTHKTN